MAFHIPVAAIHDNANFVNAVRKLIAAIFDMNVRVGMRHVLTINVCNMRHGSPSPKGAINEGERHRRFEAAENHAG